MALIVFHVQDPEGRPIPDALLSAVSAEHGNWTSTVNPCGDATTELAPGHYDITITAPGFQTRLLPADLADPGVVTVGLAHAGIGSGPGQPDPGRREVLDVNITFQGLTVAFPTKGVIPWFEVLAWLDDPADRDAAYQAKREAGDSHAILDLSGAYQEGGQVYQDWPGKDWSTDLPGFRLLVEEVLDQGFYVDVRLAGDGQSRGDGGYNDPVGKTYGHQWLMDHLEEILDALDGLEDRILLCPGYDGIFYGWDPGQVQAFGRKVRSFWPQAHLALEFSVGVCHLGNGPADYQPGGGLADYDLFYGEFNGWLPDHPAGDQVWQVVSRMIGPAYRRPPDQPAGDDPAPPFFLSGGTPRGPYVYHALEYDAYRWVRNQVSAATIAAERAYLKSLGCHGVG